MMLRDELVAQGVKELKGDDLAGFAFDNVSRSLLHTKQVWPWKDMCLVPPFPLFWAETYQPVAGSRPDTRTGALIRADDHGVGPQDARWTLYGRSYLENFSVAFDWSVDVDKTGRPLWQSPTTYTGRNAAMGEALTRDDPGCEFFDGNRLNTWLFVGLSWLNTRGIEQREVRTPKRRNAKQRGLPPTITYKVLDITPATGSPSSSNNPASGATPLALHRVRAYRAYYRPNKPLCGGSYTGWVIRNAHLRGSKDAGAVVKTYNLSPA